MTCRGNYLCFWLLYVVLCLKSFKSSTYHPERAQSHLKSFKPIVVGYTCSSSY